MTRYTNEYNTTPENVLELYRQGYIAFGQGVTHVAWVKEQVRWLFNLNAMNIPRSVRREVLNRKPYEVTVDQAFDVVIESCAQAERAMPGVWLNGLLRNAFKELHDQGLAHSVECWDKDGKLAGGLYGLAIGKVFFGKSMFTREPNASKVALTHLAARLWKGGYWVLDSQTHAEHLNKFGITGLPLYIFEQRLNQAIQHEACFNGADMRDENELVTEYLDFLREQKHTVHNTPAPATNG